MPLVLALAGVSLGIVTPSYAEISPPDPNYTPLFAVTERKDIEARGRIEYLKLTVRDHRILTLNRSIERVYISDKQIISSEAVDRRSFSVLAETVGRCRILVETSDANQKQAFITYEVEILPAPAKPAANPQH